MIKLPCMVSVMALTMSLLACANHPSVEVPKEIGGDRDQHGCIASAGYQWCESTYRCERSWELAKEKSIPLTEESIKSFCQQKKDS